MEPNIPVGTAAGVAKAMQRAVAGGEREQREGASGNWVAHWKMVHIVRPVWEKTGAENQLGCAFPPLTYARTTPPASSRSSRRRALRGAPDCQRGPRRQRLRPGMQAAR